MLLVLFCLFVCLVFFSFILVCVLPFHPVLPARPVRWLPSKRLKDPCSFFHFLFACLFVCLSLFLHLPARFRCSGHLCSFIAPPPSLLPGHCHHLFEGCSFLFSFFFLSFFFLFSSFFLSFLSHFFASCIGLALLSSWVAEKAL